MLRGFVCMGFVLSKSLGGILGIFFVFVFDSYGVWS